MAIAEVLPGARSTSMSSGLPKSAAVLNSKLPIVVWLYLLGIAIPLWFNVGSLSMSTMRLVLLIAVVPLSFALFRKKYGRVIPTDILLFLHILWAVIALGVNNPDKVVENIGSAAVELIDADLGVPYLTLRGRRGGSALAAAAVNALLLAGETDA